MDIKLLVLYTLLLTGCAQYKPVDPATLQTAGKKEVTAEYMCWFYLDLAEYYLNNDNLDACEAALYNYHTWRIKYEESE